LSNSSLKPEQRDGLVFLTEPVGVRLFLFKQFRHPAPIELDSGGKEE
jgi:hypothetical protein